MRNSEPILNPVTQTVTISLAMYIHMTGGSYGNNGLANELDDFLMYTFKIKRCGKNHPHNWTDCPFAHRGEKAKRRDPQKFPYHGISCPDWRKHGTCNHGPRCEFAHGIFEYWLHPTRYRTRMCEAMLRCPRKVCFFAHSPEQLRSVSNVCYECVDDMMVYPDSDPEPEPVPLAIPAAVPWGRNLPLFMEEPEPAVKKPVKVHCYGCTNAAMQSAARAAMPAAATFAPAIAGSSRQQYNMQPQFAYGESSSSSMRGGAAATGKGKEVMRTDEYYDYPDFRWLVELVD